MTSTDGQNTGVYCIRNCINRKYYVGSSSSSLSARIKKHRKLLSSNKHPNRHLQNAWNKYGKTAFVFIIFERCNPNDCVLREQYWIDLLRSANKQSGYNLSPKAGSVLGVVWSSESRQRVSQQRKGKKLSPSAIAKRTEKQTGMKRSAATKSRMSESAKRRGISIKTRQKMILAMRLPEVRAKRASFQRGRKASTEVRIAMSISQRRRFQNPEERQKLALTKIGNCNRLGVKSA